MLPELPSASGPSVKIKSQIEDILQCYLLHASYMYASSEICFFKDTTPYGVKTKGFFRVNSTCIVAIVAIASARRTPF